MERGKLTGKVALVTGSSRGIGAAIAKRLASDGATVAINYTKNKEAAEQVAKEIRDAGGKATIHQADISKIEEVKRLVEDVVSKNSRLDILVNNAAFGESKPLGQITPEHVEQIFGTNLFGPLWATQEALKHLPKGGRIVNVGSVASKGRFPNYSIYSAAKGALDVFTKTFSLELREKEINVNSVNPGVIETDMSAPVLREIAAGRLPGGLLGKVGQPSNIADIVGFLASPESEWVNGELFWADAGFSL